MSGTLRYRPIRHIGRDNNKRGIFDFVRFISDEGIDFGEVPYEHVRITRGVRIRGIDVGDKVILVYMPLHYEGRDVSYMRVIDSVLPI